MKTYPLETVQAALTTRGFSGRTAEAVALVLVTGVTQAEAARQIGVGQAAVTRMLGKLSVTRKCRGCGHSIKEIKL